MSRERAAQQAAKPPASDQIAKWKAAVAASHKQQRRQRGRRRDASRTIGPGMIRIPPERTPKP